MAKSKELWRVRKAPAVSDLWDGFRYLAALHEGLKEDFRISLRSGTPVLLDRLPADMQAELVSPTCRIFAQKVTDSEGAPVLKVPTAIK